MPASLLVAARWPSQHPSCRHRHRCRLHGPRQSASRLVDREERPSHTFLTFDAPNTWPRISCCQEDPLPPLGLSGAPPPMCPRASTPPSKLGFRPRYATTVLVPSLWDLTTSTVYSAAWVPGLLHPGTGPGVRWVSVKLAVTARRQLGRGPHSHQRHTLRRFTPRRQPYPIAEVHSLLTVQTRSGAERHPTAEPASTNGGNSPCVSRSDEAWATGDGWAFPPLRHHTRAALARRSRCWSLCEPKGSSCGRGLPLAAGHQHSNLVTSTLRSTGSQDLLARCIDLHRPRDLPMLPAQGLGQALGFRHAARETRAAQATPER
jgi:hypothetical protein